MSKIFICDPEEGIRESLKLILSEHYELILTDTVTQCLACLENVKDAKILLLNEESSKGFGAKAIKEIAKGHPKLKIITIADQRHTAKADKDIIAGASGKIAKPFKAEEVLATIKKLSSK